ncbi:MAG: CHAD domain-containing protein [Bryobacterales bacterium]|nr:CHAD domain-containing protein [Bryobacterales bacterium]MBV9398923.1 CHAD domain-containing protein [Bryobacterales bacterium]
MRTAEKTLDRFVEASLQERLKKLSSELRKTAKDPKNPDHIHDLRVAVRRYTQGLRVFKHLLDRNRVKKMRRRLKKIMDACGAVRNCDISLEVLQVSGAPVPGSLDRRLKKLRSEKERDLAQLLESSSATTKTKRWEDWLKAETGPNQTIASTARRVLAPLSKQFLDAGVQAAAAQATPIEMHRFRLQGKRIRYTLEIFGPIAGPDWEQWIATIRDLQERLGGINDCATTRDVIADPSGDQALREAESALEVLLRQRVAAFHEYWNANLGPDQRRHWLSKVRQIGKSE